MGSQEPHKKLEQIKFFAKFLYYSQFVSLNKFQTAIAQNLVIMTIKAVCFLNVYAFGL